MSTASNRVMRKRIAQLAIIVALAGLVCLLWPWIHRADSTASLGRFSNAESTGLTPYPVSTAGVSQSVQSQVDRLRPDSAGWTSESMSSAIDQRLQQIGALLTAGKDVNASQLDLFAQPFRGRLVPSEALVPVFESQTLVAHEMPADFQGFVATDSVIAQFQALGLGAENVEARHKFKVVGISIDQEAVLARILLEVVQITARNTRQWNAALDSRWIGNQQTLRLQEVKISELTLVNSIGSERPQFQDVTASVFGKLGGDEGHLLQICQDTGYWSKRLCKIDDADMFGHHGLAVGDVNLDGRPDLYVCDTGGLPNRLYVQTADGTLEDISRKSMTDWLEATRSALLVDVDNDEDVDLVVAMVAGIVIAENNGRGEFRVRAVIPDITEAYSMTAADYDNDGDLDVYVAVYGAGGSAVRARGFEAAAPLPYDDANNGGANILLRNQGGFRFDNMTRAAGLDANNRRYSFAASWEDFDTDGDMDLYVANDFGRNNLYENSGGQFRDVASQLGVEDRASGMSVSWGDPNQDGHPDIYVGNMFSAAGSRVTYQRKFLTTRTEESAANLQRMARGNTLFLANPGTRFLDASQASAVWMGRWAWASKFADLNNDGLEDLIVANGYFTNQNQDDL